MRRSVVSSKETTSQSPAEKEIKEIISQYHLTDAGNAESFKTLCGGEFCYVPQKGKWFTWDSVRWTENDESAQLAMLKTVRTRGEIGMVLNDNDQRAKMIRWSLGSESTYRIKSALSLAEAMLKVDLTEFDKDPYSLCCANGVVDLRTGDFRPTKPEDRLERSTNVIFDPNAKCPRWLRFLWEVFKGNEELIDFIKRAVGYTLTGDTSEQCLFINYGDGENGKSVFLGIVEKTLGDYEITTPSSTLKERRGDDTIPNDIARMCGARFVKSIEYKESIRMNEERVKVLTGGDRIVARFLHKEFFEYTPNFKIWIAVNHKPIIRGTDAAIWRRIRLIPFEVKFPSGVRDSHLGEKLQLELSGVLNWAIKGCLEWQKRGLEPPNKVRKATEAYREESDMVGRFLEERTVQAPGEKVAASELYAAFQRWCVENSEQPITGTMFGKRMTEKGFEKVTKPYTHYLGIKLLTPIFSN